MGHPLPPPIDFIDPNKNYDVFHYWACCRNENIEDDEMIMTGWFVENGQDIIDWYAAGVNGKCGYNFPLEVVPGMRVIILTINERE